MFIHLFLQAIVGCTINALGAIVRVLGVYLCSSNNRFSVVLFGQILSACMQPFVLSMPTKIAALWFGDHERTIANTIATMGMIIMHDHAIIINSPNPNNNNMLFNLRNFFPFGIFTVDLPFCLIATIHILHLVLA